MDIHKKVSKNFQILRENMLNILDAPPPGNSHTIYSFFKNTENINNLVFNSCEVFENRIDLDFDKYSTPKLLFNLLKIAKRHVLLRDFLIFMDEVTLLEAFSVLYSINLVDYGFREGAAFDLKDVVEIYIKED
jgi:hypothetical protein